MVDSHDGQTLKVSAHGSVEFTDDETDVQKLSPGGYITIEESNGRWISTDSQKFDARDKNGTIVRTYYANGKEVSADEGRAWLKTFLPELLREMAFNADRRVARQLAKGGPGLVLDEIGRVKSSYAKGVYFRELFTQAKLDQPMLSRSLQQAAREVHSDYDLAETLIAASKHQALDRALMDFVAAARAVKSDYDEGRVLQEAIASPSATPAVAAAVFSAATPGPNNSGIQSDYDLAELLCRTPPALIEQSASGWAAAIGSIGSSYDRSRAIGAALKPGAAPAAVQAALNAASGISSDYDLATLLTNAASAGALTDRTAAAFFGATSHVNGSYDRGRVMHEIAKSSLTDQPLAQAVGLAAEMSSDYDRAEALIALSQARGIGPAAKKALSESASAMHGDYDRGRVLSALSSAGIR
jgi:hypothetical protein